MSTVDPGMEALLDTFIYETNTMLEQLDEILLESERAKNISEENINSIFRITHTIKGSAAMMGFSGISSLAHAVEDVFYIIRESPEKLNLVFDAMFDLVFQSSDFLKGEMERISDDDYVENDPSSLISQLEQQAAIMNNTADAAAAPAAETTEPAPAAEQPAAPEAAAPAASSGMTRIRVFFEDDCQMENMRAFMLLTQLQHACSELESDPPHPETDGNLCATIIKNGFLVICKPLDSLDDVIKIIENSLEIKSYEVLPNEEPAPAPAEAAPAPAATAAAAPKAAAPKAAAPAPAASSAPKRNAEAPKAAGGGSAKQSLISVNQSKLDHLLDLVGELVTAESMVASNPDLKGLKLDNFTKSTRELRKLTDELQDVVMSIRMVPLHGTFQKMNRIVRDMCKKLDKKVDLISEGGDTEVDKTINDGIADPFMHMIRNSIDHGIESPAERLQLGKPETGTVRLSARNVGSDILIDIADDGAGLNPEVLLNKARQNGLLTKPESEYTDKEIYQLIMLPGFSTNTEVTEYSGRGVGMDVVRKNVEKMGGSISIASGLHKGTTFTIKIPLTLAIVDGMNIAVGDTVFTAPITSIKQSFKITDKSQLIHNTNGTEMIMIRGECFPVIHLHDLFEIPRTSDDITEGIMIQVESGGTGACLYADELLGEYQVVVKPFPTFLNRYNLKDCGLAGCSIMGDGTISLILDVNNLLNRQ